MHNIYQKQFRDFIKGEINKVEFNLKENINNFLILIETYNVSFNYNKKEYTCAKFRIELPF
jgi:hypothetical protein